MAYAPVKTPVFSLLSSVLSKSDLDAQIFLYSATLSFCSSVVIMSTSSCSGDKTQYVAPNNVSHLVVNTVNVLSLFLILKITCAPTDLPIQFRCISLVDSGQSISLQALYQVLHTN